MTRLLLRRLLRSLASVVLVGLMVFWLSCLLPSNQIATLGTYRQVISREDCATMIHAAETYAAAAAAAKKKTKTTAKTKTNYYQMNAPTKTTNTSSAIIVEDNADNADDGWFTDRHSKYATTDFQLWSIPAATELWKTKIRHKVFPIIAQQYNLTIHSNVNVDHTDDDTDDASNAVQDYDLELADLFIVKYSSNSNSRSNSNRRSNEQQLQVQQLQKQYQDSLPLHTDGSMVSFNLALSEYNNNDNDNDDNANDDDDDDDTISTIATRWRKRRRRRNKSTSGSSNHKKHTYTGGGTYFPLFNNRTVHLHQGDLLIHDSGLLHAGIAITEGYRYILVGFVNIKSYTNWIYRYRHFGTTATCIKHITTTTPSTIAPTKTTTSTAPAKIDNKEKDEELICPGTRTARNIMLQHYTQGYIDFDNDDNGTYTGDDDGNGNNTLPKSLVWFGIIVHVFLLLRVIHSLIFPSQ